MQGILVTVRTGSSRLPKKVLAEVFPGVRALDFLLARLKSSSEADLVIVCTTQLAEDDVIVEIANSHGVKVFRGSVEDKLDRWLNACKEYGVTTFVTADGDDLLCEPLLIDRALRKLGQSNLDFIEAPQAPCGAFTYAIRFDALNAVCQIKKSSDTEMMWVYFKDTGLFQLGELEIESEISRPQYRMTLDYVEDLEFFRTVIRYFEGRADVPMFEVIKYLDENPHVVNINSFRQEEFLINQANRTHLEI